MALYSALIGGIALGAYLIVGVVWDAKQDACAFGPVSNAQYRQTLSDVQYLQKTEWQALPFDQLRKSGTNDSVNEELTRRVVEIEKRLPDTIYGRVAAIHAVMRGVGGEYMTTLEDDGKDAEHPYKYPRGGVEFRYRLDANDFGFRRIFYRGIKAIFVLSPPPDFRDVRGAAIVPSFKSPQSFERSRFHPHCPAVPN